MFIITGSADTWIEVVNDGWKDFTKITSPTKVFIDVNKRGHLEPLLSQDEAIPIVNFYKAFVYGTLSTDYFYNP